MSTPRRVLLTIASRVVMAALQAGTSILVARYLGPDRQGLYSLLLWLIGMSLVIGTFGVDLGTTVAVSRGSVPSSTALGNVLIAGLAAGALTGGIAMLASGALARLFHQGNSADFTFSLRVAALGGFWVIVATYCLSILQGSQRFVWYNLGALTSPVALLVSAAGVVLLGLGLRGMIWARVLGLAVAAVLVFVAVLSTSGWRLGFDLRLLLRTARYGSLFYCADLLSYLVYRVNMLLLGSMVAPSYVGLYAVAVMIAELLWLVPNALTIVMLPSVASRSEKEGVRLVGLAVKFSLYTAIVLAVALRLVDTLVVGRLFGARYLGAVDAMRLLYPAVVALSVAKVFGSYTLAVNAWRANLIVTATALGANVVVNLALIPRMGIQGAALASSMAYLLSLVMFGVWFGRRSGATLGDFVLIRSEDLANARGVLAEFSQRLWRRN